MSVVVTCGLNAGACSHDVRVRPRDGAAPERAIDDAPDAPRDAAFDVPAEAQDATTERADATTDLPEDARIPTDGACPEATPTRCGERCCVTACEAGSCLEVAEVAVGRTHACARMTNGSVYCWGRNDADDAGSQLGDGTQQSRITPARVLRLGFATQLAIADTTTCALLRDGSVACWKPYEAGPTVVSGLGPSPVTAITARANHACALRMDGAVWCWGDNTHGQLGNSTTVASPVPVSVQMLTGVQQISAGDGYTCAVQRGAVLCWGRNNRGQLGDGTTMDRHDPTQVSGLSAGALAVTAGYDHTCAVMADHTARCWGYNERGQLGDGSTSDHGSPVAVSNLAGVDRLAAGYAHTCAVMMVDRTVQCWGQNARGELGAMGPDSARPLGVAGLGAVSQLSTGYSSNCALRMNGALRCWGQDHDGQLGDESVAVRSPVAVTGLAGVARVAAGELHTCAVVDGGVRCWGSDDEGQLGDRPARRDENTASSEPVPVLGLTGVAEVSPGFQYTCARLVNGTVECWGIDNVGQLGTGDPSRTDQDIPRPVLDRAGGPSLGGVRQIAASYYHVCALMTGDAVRCWGQNNHSQLGVATMQERNPLPLVIQGLSDAEEIDVGPVHTCARRTGGTVQCWGEGLQGSLGGGTAGPRVERATVTNLTTVAQVALSEDSSCALRMDGTVQCWGRNHEGQIGNGTRVSQPVPSAGQAAQLNGVAEIAAGNFHVCARLTDATVRCWGLNNFGQLGDGTLATRDTPAPVPGLAGVTALAGGGYHSCALLRDQTVRCWGRNTHGQVGNGVTLVRSVPRPVLWQ